MSIEISIIREWENEDLSFIREGLKKYNIQFTASIPYSKPEAINFILKEDEKVIGGLIGCFYWNCCHIDILWIDDGSRRMGYGTKLLQKIEEDAREKDCLFIHLDTLSFQALPFYKKHGYSVFGKLSGYPDGIERYYLKKELQGEKGV